VRVLQVTPNFAPHVGGVETHVQEVSQRLVALGLEVEVVTADPTHLLAQRELIAGVPVRRLPAHPRDRDWMLSPALPSVIRSGGWDLIHIQSYHTLFAPTAMAAAARARIPYVLTFHSGGTSSPLRGRVRGLQMRSLTPLLRRARTLIVVSEFERTSYQDLIGASPERFVKIPNGVSIPAGLEPIPADGRLIVSLGRLERYKGHARVLEALPTVIQQVPDACLWIAGDGPEQANLEARARELGLADRVEVGRADRVTLARRLMGASLVTLLSEFEAHPLAVIEAAALGVPVLVADNSGMSELAASGLARAVELQAGAAEHGHAMVAAMSAGAADVRISSWEECARDLADLYARVLGVAA
jgi:glycosyltransferase involved in cell wall biosynthesis